MVTFDLVRNCQVICVLDVVFIYGKWECKLIYYPNCRIIFFVPSVSSLSSAGRQEQIERNSGWQTALLHFSDFHDILINNKNCKAMILMWISLRDLVGNTFGVISGVKNMGDYLSFKVGFIVSNTYLPCKLEYFPFLGNYLWEFRCWNFSKCILLNSIFTIVQME